MAVLGCHRAACTPPVANHLGAGTARDIDIQQRSMMLGRALPSQICTHDNSHEATGWHSKMRLPVLAGPAHCKLGLPNFSQGQQKRDT